MEVIINIGVSGSGKSTWTRKFVEQCEQSGSTVVVCSADKFHEDEFGFYKFDPSKAAMAHAECFNKFIRAVSNPANDFVVVDNTNVSEWERKNYVDLASSLCHDVKFNVWTCNTVEAIKFCAGRNEHGVPVGVVADMAIRMEIPDGVVTYRNIGL